MHTVEKSRLAELNFFPNYTKMVLFFLHAIIHRDKNNFPFLITYVLNYVYAKQVLYIIYVITILPNSSFNFNIYQFYDLYS